MIDNSPAVQYLIQRGIPHRIFHHAVPPNSLEQAAFERGQTPQQVVRSIVFRIADGEFIMVLAAGSDQISWKMLRRYLNRSRITMATEDELITVTGCKPGTVSPFGLPHPMPVLVEKRVLDQKEVSLGSCQRGLAIILSPTDLLSAIDTPQVVDLSG